MKLKDYSQIVSFLLNDYFDEFKLNNNFDSVKVGVIKSNYGIIISISFVFKEPFKKEESEMIQNNVNKSEIKQLLMSFLPNTGDIDISINTCTKEVWERNYKPRYE